MAVPETPTPVKVGAAIYVNAFVEVTVLESELVTTTLTAPADPAGVVTVI